MTANRYIRTTLLITIFFKQYISEEWEKIFDLWHEQQISTVADLVSGTGKQRTYEAFISTSYDT